MMPFIQERLTAMMGKILSFLTAKFFVTLRIKLIAEMSQKYPTYKGLNLPDVADRVLEKWDSENVFVESVENREGQPSFIFFEGPPSANGLPGIHHAMGRTIKDIFCRYKTLKGFQVKRKAGWDTHGLPVELGVEKELGITKEDIGKKISVEDYNNACKKAVMRYTDVWNDLTRKAIRSNLILRRLAPDCHRMRSINRDVIEMLLIQQLLLNLNWLMGNQHLSRMIRSCF